MADEVSSVPSTPAPAAPAASAPAASTSSPSASTTAHAALTKAADRLATPSTSDPDRSQPPVDLSAEDPTGAAIGAPAATGVTPRSPGDAPESRIEAAVRNARDKVREEYAWATAYGGQEQISQAVQRWQRLNANPVEFLTSLAKETGYKVVPIDEPASSGPPPLADLVDPEPDLRAEDGTKAFSDKAMRVLVKNETERLRRQLVEEMAPALQFATEGRQQAQQAELRNSARDFVARSYGEVSRLPHFNRERVAAEYSALTEAQRVEMGTHGALMTAYTNDLVKRVLPTLGSSQQAATIEDLRRSAVAGSPSAAAATPRSASSKVSIKDGDTDGLAAHMERLYGGGAATP